MSQLYLTTPEGQRLLVAFISLHAPFVDSIYAALRNLVRGGASRTSQLAEFCPDPVARRQARSCSQIAGSNKATLTTIGDILFRAWRDADGPLLQKLGKS